MSEPTIKHPGLPIFSDSLQRDISDPTEDTENPIHWQPANQLAGKLWRCLEALRDIQEILEDAKRVTSPKKQRRRLKILATPTLSLAQNVRSLCNSLATDPNLAEQLTTETRKRFQRISEAFDHDMPLGSESPLRVIRDRMSAHVDKKMLPQEAREILDKAEPSTYGRWLHSCIWVLQEVMQPDVYAWRSKDGPERSIRLMNVEPWILTIDKNPEGELRLVGTDIGTSPKFVVLRACEDIVKESQWLFRATEECLVILDRDSRDNAT